MKSGRTRQTTIQESDRSWQNLYWNGSLQTEGPYNLNIVVKDYNFNSKNLFILKIKLKSIFLFEYFMSPNFIPHKILYFTLDAQTDRHKAYLGKCHGFDSSY